jgi:transposase, IS30 family
MALGSALPPEERSQIRRLYREGLERKEIAARLGHRYVEVHSVLRVSTKAHELTYSPSPARLSLTEREEIRAGLERGETYKAIAQTLGRATSTISREVAANRGREGYRAVWAHRRASRCARRPKPFKLDNEELFDQVREWLTLCWSPQEISARLRLEYPDDPMMQVSHEAIYHSLYVQGRGELRRELTRCLRSGRAERRPQGRTETRGRLPEMVMISQRPAEVADRAVPGHWEGDLIMGKNLRSAVGTLVERSTRYVLLLDLSKGKRAEDVRNAMEKAIATLPAKLARSITWDQGSEMAEHREFTMATGIPVYFCDPHSPWQRGSNENTNGLLRQFLPKGTDLSAFSRADLDEIERKMNGRPRKTLDWLKPCEKLAELIAPTP